ncbi:MAG: DUF1592 domain-containing protein [Candidatus Hydrogenedentes bacterium]|nr:DUF1592 domain-containing protein [Candidatus Hydrogenedentota bacterium]
MKKYSHSLSPLSVAAIIASAMFLPPAARAEGPTYEKDFQPVVQQFCMPCHDAEHIKGDLDLERFKTDKEVIDSIAIWQRIAKRIESKEMPPRRSPQPTDEEKQKMLAWIATLKPDTIDCDQLASEETASWYPGYVMSRRLNRAEYQNTLRDLLGIELDVMHLFPADGAGGEGFDNNGSSLFLSAIQIEKYLEAADLAVETALPKNSRIRVSASSNSNSYPEGITARFPRRATKLSEYGVFYPEGITAHSPGLARRSRFDEGGATLGTSTPTLSSTPNGVADGTPSEIEFAADNDSITPSNRLITAVPSRKLPARDAARIVLTDFAQRAWRRPIAPEEIEDLLDAFDEAQKRRDGYEESIKFAFKAALVSPHFLFLAEPEPETPGNYELDDYQLATRLSYFLWSSMPDDELFLLALRDELHNTETLQKQIARMLKDPKAKALGEQFGLQWMGITQLGETTKPDATRFPEFDEAMAKTMKDEAATFFTYIVQEDRSLLELIDARYTFANDGLAKIYGLENVTGPELRKVDLADENRGGVMGMAAMLTMTSHPLRTSPVLRGKWVLEQLLGDRVPPPPPNVAQLPEDDHQPDGLTFRQRMELHRKNPDCASCHQRMDPIGFGLENFDPIGRWRTEQAGQALDASGELPDGRKFNGPKELKAIVMSQKDQFATNLSRKMVGYALGRSLTQYDDCVINNCVSALKDSDYKPSAMITQIVLSYPFRHRYSGGHEEKTAKS